MSNPDSDFAPSLDSHFGKENPQAGALRKMMENASLGPTMSPVERALGTPKVDLSDRPRRKIVMEQAVCMDDLADVARVLVDLIGQMSKGDGLATESFRYARHLADVLAREKARREAEKNAEVDALALEALRRGAGKEAPIIIAASPAHIGGRVSSSMARTGDAPLDASMDPARWAMALMEWQHGQTHEAWSSEGIAPFFARALGAGIAAGRVRERGVMIEELQPVFRNLEILDLWEDKLRVPGGERGLPLHADPDARRWAREFIETIDQLETKAGHKLCDPATFDEGWLVSWFANAMTASYDWAMARRDRLEAEKARLRTAHVFGPLLFTTILQAANAKLVDSCSSKTEKGETFKGIAIRVQPWKREHGQSAPQLAVVIAWKKRKGPGLLERWRGHVRMTYGFCPCCNSDAPEVDRCEVCLGYRSADGQCEFPPSGARKAVWRKRWMEGKGLRPLQGEAMACGAAMSDSAPSIVADKSDSRFWCKSHNREATHIYPAGAMMGKPCCDPQLGGVMVPCDCVEWCRADEAPAEDLRS